MTSPLARFYRKTVAPPSSPTDALNPLFAAILCNNVHQLNKLLLAGADVNGVCSQFGSPLLLASAHGRHNMVRALLAANADPNIDAAREFGVTALGLSVERGDKDTVAALLAAKADVGARQLEMTPLMLAAGLGHMDIIAMLLHAGADVDEQNDRGDTAISLAVAHGHWCVADMLVAAAAGALPPKQCPTELDSLISSILDGSLFNILESSHPNVAATDETEPMFADFVVVDLE